LEVAALFSGLQVRLHVTIAWTPRRLSPKLRRAQAHHEYPAPRCNALLCFASCWAPAPHLCWVRLPVT